MSYRLAFRLTGLVTFVVGVAMWCYRSDFSEITIPSHGVTKEARFAPSTPFTFAPPASNSEGTTLLNISGNIDLKSVSGTRQTFFELVLNGGKIFMEFDPGRAYLIQVGITQPAGETVFLPLGIVARPGRVNFSLVFSDDGSLWWFAAGVTRTAKHGIKRSEHGLKALDPVTLQLNQGNGSAFTDSMTQVSISNDDSRESSTERIKQQWHEYQEQLPNSDYNFPLYIGLLVLLLTEIYIQHQLGKSHPHVTPSTSDEAMASSQRPT